MFIYAVATVKEEMEKNTHIEVINEMTDEELEFFDNTDWAENPCWEELDTAYDDIRRDIEHDCNENTWYHIYMIAYDTSDFPEDGVITREWLRFWCYKDEIVETEVAREIAYEESAKNIRDDWNSYNPY